MRNSDWREFRHFHLGGLDNWGEPARMSYELVKTLDNWRECLGVPFYVRFGTQGIHSPVSLHYRGEAVDGILDGERIHLLDILCSLLRFPFTEIGFYPDWNGIVPGYDRLSKPIGLHLGLGEIRPRVFGATTNLWMRAGSKYLPLDVAHLKIHAAKFL